MGQEKVFELVNQFCKADYSAIKAFIQTLPQTENTDNTMLFLDGRDPFYIIVGLDGLAGSYYFKKDFDHANIFSFATYYCVQKYLEAPFTQRKDEMLYYGGSSSYYILKYFLDNAGFHEGIEFYQLVLDYYKDLVNTKEFISAQLTAVDLFYSSNQAEKARHLFTQIPVTCIQPFNKIYYDRLAENLRQLFSDVSVLPTDATFQKAAQLQKDLQDIIDSIEHAIFQTAGQPSPKETADLDTIKNLMLQIKACKDDKKLLELCNVVSKKINVFFMGDKETPEANLVAKRLQLQDIAKEMFDTEDIRVLEDSLNQLNQVLPFFEKKYPGDETLTQWMIAMCHNRLQHPLEAIAHFEKVHENLEHIHATITDKKERGGVFRQYPYLFSLLVSNYYLSGNTRGVLKAMEASKGRVLADITFAGDQTEAYHALPEKLEQLLAKEKAHFLGFFVDETYTISILVTSDGKYYGKGIDIKKSDIDDWISKQYQNPANWNNVSMGLFGGNKSINMSAELEKFLPTIKLAMEEGHVHEGDHIIYAQDENFMLFPLHYATFNGGYLIEHFSVSRIHNAFQLLNLIPQEGQSFNEVEVFSVPAQQDKTNVEKWEAFQTVKTWLQENIKMPVASKDTDIRNLQREVHAKSIIHFATHGVFPNIEIDDPVKNNPFYNSGILLNAGEQPPLLDVNFDYYKMENLLSPEKLLKWKNLFNECHISLQACVSGRSREGIGGDAIGMEWAAFFAGAQSMLSAAWDIDIFWVNKFFISFYNYWLNQHMTKAAAYAATIRDLLKNKFPEDRPNVYFWGGMILSGNWKT